MSSAKMKKVKKCAALDKQHTDAEKKSARATERARQQSRKTPPIQKLQHLNASVCQGYAAPAGTVCIC